MAISKDDDVIRVGDMVVVVRWLPCGCGLGKFRVVKAIESPSHIKSAKCSEEHADSTLVSINPPIAFFVGTSPWAAPIAWCKKIKRVGDEEKSKESIHYVKPIDSPIMAEIARLNVEADESMRRLREHFNGTRLYVRRTYRGKGQFTGYIAGKWVGTWKTIESACEHVEDIWRKRT